MHTGDWLGIFGSVLVFASFWMKSTVPLRLVALASNVVFIAYAYSAWLIPILVLHCALLPLNLVRLWQRYRQPQANGEPQRTVRTTALPASSGQTGAKQRTEGSVSEAF